MSGLRVPGSEPSPHNRSVGALRAFRGFGVGVAVAGDRGVASVTRFCRREVPFV